MHVLYKFAAQNITLNRIDRDVRAASLQDAVHDDDDAARGDDAAAAAGHGAAHHGGEGSDGRDEAGRGD